MYLSCGVDRNKIVDQVYLRYTLAKIEINKYDGGPAIPFLFFWCPQIITSLPLNPPPSTTLFLNKPSWYC